MKIISLEAENIKRLKAIQITPEGNVVVISGKNGNGKSSILDSLAMALGGAKLIPQKPVREGELEAKINIDMGDYIVERHWTNPETSYLKVSTKDGAKIGNGQSVLDKIVGNLSFDPLKFATMEPQKRTDILKEITGLDFSKLDKEYSEVYIKRRDLARSGEQAAATLKQFDELVVLEPVASVDEIKKQKEEAELHNKAIDEAKSHADSASNGVENYTESIASKKKQIEALKKEIKEVEVKLKEKEAVRDSYLEKAKAEKIDTTKFEASIESFYAYESNLKEIERKKTAQTSVDELRKDWQTADNRLKEIAAEKQKTLEETKMPIDGLSFGDKEVVYNGIPFSQLSTSEQIRVSFAISIAMNPRLKIAIIKDGSLLDNDAMLEIAKIANESETQVWIERVANGPENGVIYIEDGEIKA
ncbi:AAA family ATPase [Lactococcus petauri]